MGSVLLGYGKSESEGGGKQGATAPKRRQVHKVSNRTRFSPEAQLGEKGWG